MVRHTLQCLVLQQGQYHAVRAQVEQLSERAQAVIQRYAGAASALAGAHAGMCAVTGMLPWAHPTSQEYEELARVTPCCDLWHGCSEHATSVVYPSVGPSACSDRASVIRTSCGPAQHRCSLMFKGGSDQCPQRCYDMPLLMVHMPALLDLAPNLSWACPEVQESEYAAWVLVNGFALNHMTVSVHRLHGFKCAPMHYAP